MYNYFVLHFFICQLIATCLACLRPFISFLIIILTFSKFMLVSTGIFLPSACSNSTAKLYCAEEKMIHVAVNVEDSMLSMHHHCKKKLQTDKSYMDRWTGRQRERHTDRQTDRQTDGVGSTRKVIFARYLKVFSFYFKFLEDTWKRDG